MGEIKCKNILISLIADKILLKWEKICEKKFIDPDNKADCHEFMSTKWRKKLKKTAKLSDEFLNPLGQYTYLYNFMMH